jgi:hypothetical protein
LSYVLLTNDSTPVKLENGDRRYCIFNTGSNNKGNYDYWAETASLFNDDAVAGTIFAFLMSVDLTNFNVSKFPVTELREIMIDAERPTEENFLIEMASQLDGDEWRGSCNTFYQLYANWCNKYDIRPKSTISFGRELTPYMLKGWIFNYKSNGIHGRGLNLSLIRAG